MVRLFAVVKKVGPGPVETMVGGAKLQVSNAGGQGVAVVKGTGPGPIETMVTVVSL